MRVPSRIKLTAIYVNLDQLMLDPNNYRLFGTNGQSDERFEDRQILEEQDRLNKQLSKENLDDLKDSITENGFLEVDRIVVREIQNSSKGEETKYVVIEGNRRTAALKSLKYEHQLGLISLPTELLNQLNSLSVLLVKGSQEEINSYSRILMGIRHVSGIRKWSGMQSAKLIYDLATDGKTPTEIGDILGISAIEANRRKRGYIAYKQLKNDSTYSEFVKSKHYTLLLEFLARKNVLEWLAWDEDASNPGMQNKKHREIIYNEITDINGKAFISNPRTAREMVKAISIDYYRKELENGIRMSELVPIVDGEDEFEQTLNDCLKVVSQRRRNELSDSSVILLGDLKRAIDNLINPFSSENTGEQVDSAKALQLGSKEDDHHE